ncbi:MULTISPECIES: membrane lipoprotein lipid attachment site-containing protein [Paenisporosarcina]|nr:MULTISPECIES: membrane lipoprotein lipid attachment site-containing protein [Paenisporosarcina]
MKSLLFAILAMFMLTGCGTDNNGGAIGTQEEPSGQEREFVPESMTEDEKSDMSNTNK